jgi:hypothetical protein
MRSAVGQARPLGAWLAFAQAEEEPDRSERRPRAGLGPSALRLVAATHWLTGK